MPAPLFPPISCAQPYSGDTVPLTGEKAREGSAARRWLSALLPPLPVLGKRPASVAALPTGCRGRRGARAGVQAAAGSCLLRGLWSLLGLCALSRSEQMGPRKEPLWHCCWASVAFSAIVYFISPQSRSSLRKTWCLFGPSLSKRELWGLSILQGHQWNFCSLSSVRVCSGSR